MSNQEEFAIPNAPTRKPSNDPPRPPPLNYQKPSWSGPPTYSYRLEVLKNGQSLEAIDGPKDKEFVTIGRLPLCDIPMEHLSISRYQAVIQFDQDGDAYLYDMDSAHGTRLNKKQIPGREYVPLKPGDQIRFGESTRLCIFDSDKPFDPEAEAEERRRIALKQKIASAQGEELTPDDDEEDTGASWGFAEDAVEEEEEEEEDEQDPEKRAAYIEASLNQSGDASLLNVEAAKMALEDAKRRREDLEIMYGDDSDEELYDKTSRKKKKVEKAETHDELVVRQKQTEQKIAQLEHDLAEKKKQEAAAKEQEEEDLDSFMQKLSKKPLGNEKSIFVLQKELNQLKKDNERLIKLVKLTKPSHVL